MVQFSVQLCDEVKHKIRIEVCTGDVKIRGLSLHGLFTAFCVYVHVPVVNKLQRSNVKGSYSAGIKEKQQGLVFVLFFVFYLGENKRVRAAKR